MIEDKDENQNTLYIPINIKTRFEFLSGFGFSELAVTAVVTVISIVAAMVIKSLSEDIYKGVLLVLVTAASTIMAVRKNEMNQSVTDIIKLFFRFINSQQKFGYEYYHKYKNRSDLL